MTALSVATLGLTGVAGAAETARTPLKPAVAAHPSGVPFGASSSSYLAGYQATPSGGLASASVTFTIPAATCTAKDIANDANEWNGLYTDSLDAYALIGTYCSSSGPMYDYEVSTEAGDNIESGAAAGDVVVASLFQSGTSSWAELHDITANVYWYADNDVNQGDTVVDIGTYNDVAESLPIPTFTKAKFTNATVNGDYLGFESPTEFNALNGGDLLLKTGKLSTTGTGSAFAVTFKRAS